VPLPSTFTRGHACMLNAPLPALRRSVPGTQVWRALRLRLQPRLMPARWSVGERDGS
jgi:hypothetical protein